MNIQNMLNQLKDILPAENFKIQPAAARDELLQLEREYNINTSDFIKNNICTQTIPEDVAEKWINTLDTFINFDGAIEELNHLSSSDSFLKNKLFINKTPKGTSSKEYVKEASKESNWLPCLFLCLDNFLNFHSLFWMEQKSRICS